MNRQDRIQLLHTAALLETLADGDLLRDVQPALIAHAKYLRGIAERENVSQASPPHTWLKDRTMPKL